MRRNQNHREEDPAASTTNQRQGRTVPSHPARGMGLHPTLDLRDPTGQRLHALHPLLQSPPTPWRARLGNPPQHPPGQPPRGAHLVVLGWGFMLAGVGAFLADTVGPFSKLSYPDGPSTPRFRYVIWSLFAIGVVLMVVGAVAG